MGAREFSIDQEETFNRSGPIRWIISHAARYPAFPIGMLLAAVFNNVAYSSIQVAIGRAFDLISAPIGDRAALLAVALTVLVAALAQGLTGLLRNFFGEFLAQHVERDTRHEFYVSLLGKSQTFHGRQRIGDVMARATNDVRALNMMFNPGLMLITDSLLNLIVPIVMIALIDVELLLVPIIFVILLSITLRDYGRRLSPVTIALREQFGLINAGLAEAISGIEVVKANVQESYEWDKFTQNASKYRDLFVEQGEIQARYWPMLAFSICWALGFFHALVVWRGGGITLGQVVAVVGLVGALRFPTFISLFSFDLVQLGIASARRILEMINTESDLDENRAGRTDELTGQIRFEDVTFSYNGTPILEGVSFEAQPGETVAIVGRTGSGKTSLSRLINRIFDVDKGRVVIDDVDVRDWSLEALRSQVASIEQDIFLFSDTIAENIAFGQDNATREQIEWAARQAQAQDFILSFKDGYETEIGERGVMLSGGQRQRLAIARAFLSDPRILILDDSTSAIDSATEDRIQRAMREISHGRTTILITHRLSQIRWADRILVISRGRVVAQGTHSELMRTSPDYRVIFARYEDDAHRGSSSGARLDASPRPAGG